MEHCSIEDPSQATFSFVEEDHTLANSVRFTLNQDPRVSFCGYSIPHPSDARVNIRVQTTECGEVCTRPMTFFLQDLRGCCDPAREVLKDGCQNLMFLCQHVRSTFEKAVNDYKTSNPIEMDYTTNNANEMETSSE